MLRVSFTADPPRSPNITRAHPVDFIVVLAFKTIIASPNPALIIMRQPPLPMHPCDQLSVTVRHRKISQQRGIRNGMVGNEDPITAKAVDQSTAARFFSPKIQSSGKATDFASR